MRKIKVTDVRSVPNCGQPHESVYVMGRFGIALEHLAPAHLDDSGECVRPRGHPTRQHMDRDGHLYGEIQ